MTSEGGDWAGRIRAGFARVAGFFNKAHREKDLDEELQFHIEMLTEQYEAKGMSNRDARAAARREFGQIASVKEAYRTQRGVPLLETALSDLRYAVRSYRNAPLFTVTVLAILALGIGANSAIFSVVNAALLRPLPYHDPSRLVQVTRKFPQDEATHLDGRCVFAVFDQMQTVESVAAFRTVTGFNIVTTGGAEYVRAQRVSRDYFKVLGTTSHMGRSFTTEEDRPGGPDVAIVSYALWRRLFAGDQEIVGKSVSLGDVPHTIVGVLREDFRAIPTADVWIPLRLARTDRGSFNYRVIGRLFSDADLDRSLLEVAGIGRQLQTETPPTLSDTESLGLQPYGSVLAADVRDGLIVLAAAVVVILLISCANAANLLLGRALSRGREVAIRLALGAGYRRVFFQLLTESMLLALVAGALGLLFAQWVAPTLLSISPAAAHWREAHIDSTVLGITLLVAMGTGVMFGVAPAMTFRRKELMSLLHEEGSRATPGQRSEWLRRCFVTGEVALTVILLVCAGLLVQTFLNLRSVDLGFDPTNVLTAQMALNAERHSDPDSLTAFFDRGLDRVESIPGVHTAAVVSGIPVERGLNVVVDIPGAPETVDDALTEFRYVTPGFFSLMRVPLLSGRSITESDTRVAHPVAVVNEEFARRFLPGVQAIGYQTQVFSQGTVYEIVGVVGNMQEQGLGGNSVPVLYVPAAQVDGGMLGIAHSIFQVSWVARAQGSVAGLTQRIQQELHAVAPQQPFSGFRSMDSVIGETPARPRFQLLLMSVFSLLALVLAVAGIYAVISYTVAAREREFGVRTALGASPSRIVLNVVTRAFVLTLVGVGLGLAGAALVARMLEAFVYGIATMHFGTFAAVACGLMAVSVVASAVPATRAARVDPVVTL